MARPLVAIIDDDVSCREAIAGELARLDVRTFPSAGKFLASRDIVGCSCIIADIQMPNMTEIGLHKRLRELGYAIPTILITAYPDEPGPESGLG
jgi:FixJ family two-component response regulator